MNHKTTDLKWIKAHHKNHFHSGIWHKVKSLWYNDKCDEAAEADNASILQIIQFKK